MAIIKHSFQSGCFDTSRVSVIIHGFSAKRYPHRNIVCLHEIGEDVEKNIYYFHVLSVIFVGFFFISHICKMQQNLSV